MKQVASFFERLGGKAVVAERLGKRINTVDVTITRNRLPRGWWPELQREFNLTTDELLKIEAEADQQNIRQTQTA